MDRGALFRFVLGACIGSFACASAYRIRKDISILTPSSFCPLCRNSIPWYHNIPIIGYLALGGRCSRCEGRISIRCLLVEVLFGFLYLFLWLSAGKDEWCFFTAAVFVIFLYLASSLDLSTGLIHNKISLPGIAAGLVVSLLPGGLTFLQSLSGVLVIGGILYLIAEVSRGGMGGGDIKLAALMGAFLGIRNGVVALFAGFLLGALVGIVLLVMKKKGRKDAIPFAPFLSAGALVALLFGGKLVDFYMQFSIFNT